MVGPPLLLASGSPRRRALLAQIGVRFVAAAPAVDESARTDEAPGELAMRLAEEKAREGLARRGGAVRAALGADTVVLCGGRTLGQPAGREEALAMLAALSGREHRVLTAVCVADGRRAGRALSETAVRFREIGGREAAAYWATGEPAGKAGAYAIQGFGGVFVERIAGSYSGAVGLPLFETMGLLAEFGVPCWTDGGAPA